MVCRTPNMNKSTLLYSYSGLINPEIKTRIILDFRKTVKAKIPTVDKQKKSAYILQEALNNVLNYYTDMRFTDTSSASISCSTFSDNRDIELIFASDMLTQDAASLEAKLNNLNGIQVEALKEELLSNLNKPISGDRGASIGLITMILKSNNKLKYEFTKTDAFICKFTLTVLLQ
jgi:hypothetical protein